MKHFTRVILITIVAVMLSSTLGVAVAQDEPVTLDLWMFLDGTDFLPSVVESFQAAHTT